MDVEDNRFEKPLRNAIVKFRAESAADRAKVYAAARASLKRVPNGKIGDVEELEAAIGTIEASFTQTPPGRKFRIPRAVAMAGATFVIGGLLGATVAAYWPSAAAGGETGPLQQLTKSYDSGAAQLPAASAFLHDVVDAVIDRQKRDRAAFAESSKNFIPLEKFDADLAGRMPKSLPRGTAIVMRADAYNFKILMNWTLCGVADIAKPAMVDRIRSADMSIGCPYFGLWSAGAANW